MIDQEFAAQSRDITLKLFTARHDMPMIEKRSYFCTTVDVRVTLWRQTFDAVTFIGGSTFVQRDHDCSRASTCIHRQTEQCLVSRLNR